MGEQLESSRPEEYVLLDLEEVFHGGAIPANCPYTLAGLDTLQPTLTLGNGLKLIGEYEDTVGTCVVFSESDETVEPVEAPDPAFALEGTIVDPKPVIQKKVKSVCSLQKKLKFRVAT